MTVKMDPKIAPMLYTERWGQLYLSAGPFPLEDEVLESVRVVGAVDEVVFASMSLIRV